MSDSQRREFLTGAAAFAAATASLGGTRPAAADDKPPRPIRGDKGASIIGPTNPARESQSRDRLAPPPTDRESIRNLRFSFADLHNGLQPGGWARRVTIREMPIATDLAIVNIENTGTTQLRYLEDWKTGKFSDVSLRQWLAFTPYELVRAHLKLEKSVVENIPTRKTPVVPA
jgi:hypothetical protein